MLNAVRRRIQPNKGRGKGGKGQKETGSDSTEVKGEKFAAVAAKDREHLAAAAAKDQAKDREHIAAAAAKMPLKW